MILAPSRLIRGANKFLDIQSAGNICPPSNWASVNVPWQWSKEDDSRPSQWRCLFQFWCPFRRFRCDKKMNLVHNGN